ncbi:hypothetical protein [Stenomitos frigidus]|uniref:TnsE C-terminal domain-containing protein n=1 Tax=Stenomitos frigidus ULC18 TaxID=2107698 RepID=A0A2T1ENX2_9CYAN|nr:hypothetical protein [Stenomitos frigidus]PSB34403.1 hypothetical protein C7B82_02750 [Stenomitos frigidus ULC18]
MTEIVRLSDWLFDPGEKVTLWWLRSPLREGMHRQWRTTAVFRRTSGEFREVDFPWGLLPWLRLGQVFEDGQPVWDTKRGDIFRIQVPDSSSMRLSRAANLSVLQERLPSEAANLSEYCITIGAQQSYAILPVLECIRAFLTPNKSLAFGLLEPNYFERILIRNEVIGDKLHLDFSKDIPQRVLNRSLVFFMARLLHDQSFRNAWNSVYHDRLRRAEQASWNTAIPLRTLLPQLGATWLVRGVLLERVLFVYEILEVEPSRSLPFKELEFTHPGIRKREFVKSNAAKRQRQQKKVVEYQINPDAEPPAVSKPSLKLPQLGLCLMEKRRPKIIKTGQTSVVTLKPSSVSTEPSESEAQFKNRAVSLSDVGKGGQNPAAEFGFNVPVEIFVNTDDGLDEFSEAIRCLDEIHPEVAVHWEVHELQQEIPFATVGDRPRKYALVRLKVSRKAPCWILEFGRPDSFPISTLLFTFDRYDSAEELQALLEAILETALLPQGGWNRSPLKKIPEQIRGFKFGWSKHTGSSTEDWGERLYKNAQEVARWK